jgi:hypothetical protein
MTSLLDPYIIRAHWRAEARADGCYVIETMDGRDGNITYGPMPGDLVLSLISEARDAFEDRVRDCITTGLRSD